MNLEEKILIFRTCGMVLWTLKQIVDRSRIDEADKTKIVTRINSLIKSLTAYTNKLQANE